MQVAVVADDLTDAADTAGRFSPAGLSSVAGLWQLDDLRHADVVTVSSNSRYATVAQATLLR